MPPVKSRVSRASRGACCVITDMMAGPYRDCNAKGTGLLFLQPGRLQDRAPTRGSVLNAEREGRGRAAKRFLPLKLHLAQVVFGFLRLFHVLRQRIFYLAIQA